MEMRTVGRSGLQVSVLGLGCNNFGMRVDQERTDEVVKAALNAGITFFDTADTYGGGRSEEYLGPLLAPFRDEIVLATKFSMRTREGPYGIGASRKYLVAACERSLRRLGTDRIDLYYQHRPDPLTPVEETLAALDDLVRSGKVLYIACSTFAGWQVAEAELVARTIGPNRYVACQSEWSLLHREIEAELVPACAHFGLDVVPYFPLASGLLTGKYRRTEPAPEGTRLAAPYFAAGATDEAFDALERIQGVADRLGRSLLEVAIGWLASQPVVPSVIAGATSAAQVEANVAAADVRFSPEEMAAISEAASPA